MDLQQRVARLKAHTGIDFYLAPRSVHGESPPAAEVHGASEKQREMVQEEGSTSGTQHVQHDGPQKFLTHDAGPRARTDGAFDCSNFEVGEPTDLETAFVAWKIIRAYPDCFVGKRNKPHVVPFFEKIHQGRVWDIFYLYHPTTPKDTPYLFVPTAQFQAFLDDVNKELNIALSIPGGVNSDRFFMKFGQGGTPRPRYWRRLEDQEELGVDVWPGLNVKDTQGFMNATPVQQDDWEATFKLIKAPPVKNQGRVNKSAEKRADRQHMLEVTQALLGLSTAIRGVGDPDPILVCVDVEAIERPPNPISEIGIAVLDLKDIADTPRGPCGRNWWALIKAHHLRTREYSGLVNHEFIAGCPDSFDFGTSIFPTRAELPGAVMAILDPFIQATREIVLVGHDIKQDIQYLASVGVDVSELKSITRMLDSQAIHQAWKDLDNGRGLEGVLGDLCMPSKNLHNAGNDAVYTLRALFGVAIEDLRQREAEIDGKEHAPELWTAPASE